MKFLVRATIYHKHVRKPWVVLQNEINQLGVLALTEFFREYPFMAGDRIVIREPAMAKLKELYGKDSKAQVALDQLVVDGRFNMDLIVTRIGEEK